MKFVYKFREVALFNGWFMLQSNKPDSIPRLKVLSHRTTLFESSIAHAGISAWNEFFNSTKIIIDDKFSYKGFIEKIQKYLVGYRNNLYVYL